MKTLAELRGAEYADAVGQAEAIYPLCLAGKLVAKLQVLEAELEDLPEPPHKDEPGPPRTIMTKDPRVAKEAEIEAVRAEMEEILSPARVRSKPSGEWIEWVAAHPAREDNKDDEIAECSFDDLIRALPEHVVTITDKPLEPGDWAWVATTALHGDLREMAWLVWRLQGARVSVPKSRTASNGTNPNAPA